MNVTTALTRGGRSWTPTYAEAIDAKKCIGCGRCYKVCPRDVLALVDRGDDDERDDEADWDDEDTNSVMTIRDPLDCIGCGACGRTCPKGCFTFVSPAAA